MEVIRMNRNLKISIAVIGVAFSALLVSVVSASPRTSNTPFYTFRIEQASCKMSFLPTSMNTFTYSTRNGCTLNPKFVTDNSVVRVFDVDTYISTCQCTCYVTCEYTTYDTAGFGLICSGYPRWGTYRLTYRVPCLDTCWPCLT